MSLPTIEKSWQFAPNNVQGTIGTGVDDSVSQTLLDIKNVLTNSGSMFTWTDANGSVISPVNTWTVGYSSNSVTAGTINDGVDRWLTHTSVVSCTAGSNSGTARSWIVLKNSALDPGGNFQLLIHYGSTTTSGTQILFEIFVSRAAGFTGGSATARPTATDEVYMYCIVGQQGTYNGTQYSYTHTGYVMHCMISTDGKAHRVIISRGAFISFLLGFENSTQISGSWSPAEIVIHAGDMATNMDGPTTRGYDYARTVSFNGSGYGGGLVTTSGVAGLIGTGSFPIAMSGRGMNSDLLVKQIGINSFNGDYIIEPIGVTGPISSSLPGRHGNFTDLWWCNAPPGSTFLVSGSRKFAQFGYMMFPWNGSTAVP